MSRWLPGLLALALLGACSPTRGTIGAVLGQQPDGRLFIRETPADLAAAKAGLRPDDEILLIDGLDVRTMSSKRVHEHLVGEVGETVKLTVLRDGEVLRVTLQRTKARRRKRPNPGPAESPP